MGPPVVKFDPDTVAPFRTFTDNVRKWAKNVRKEPEMSGIEGYLALGMP